MSTLLMKADLNDLASGKLEKLGKNVRGVSGKSTALSAAFGDLKNKAESLGAPIGKLEGYFGGMPKPAMAGLAAVGLLGGGLLALGMNAVKVGADLQDMSDTTGLSVEHLSSMRNVLTASNMDVKGYSDAMAKLNINLGKNGDEFSKLGIDVTDNAKAFDQIKHKIGDIEDPIKKAELANKAFGKSYKDLMPLLTMANAEYDKMKDGTSIMSSEFAKNAAEVDDNIALLKTTFSDFAVQLGSNFLPLMKDLVGILQDAADFWGSAPDQNQINADKREEIHNKYKDLQAESDKGADLLGQKRTAVKIDGKTEFQAQMEYTESLKAATKAKEDEAKATSDAAKKLGTDQATSDKLEAAKARWDNIYEQSSYKTFLQNKNEADFKETKALENASRFDKENAVNVDYFGGNDTAYRDHIEGQNKLKDQEFYKNKHQESLANTEANSNKEGDRAVKEQEVADILAEQEKTLARQEAIYQSLNGKAEALLTGPFDTFFKSVASGNDSLKSSFSDLWDDVTDGAGNMISSIAAQLASKAVLFGLLNIMSSGGVGFATKGLEGFSWFANGTEYAYGGPALVAERAPEVVNGRLYTKPTMVNLQRGSKVSSPDNVGGGTMQQTIVINNNRADLTPLDVTKAVNRANAQYARFGKRNR